VLKGRLVVFQGLVIFVIFVAVWLLLDALAGDGITGPDVVNALITGVIFLVVYGLITYFVAKRKRRS
jgi:hypothetical protein